MQILLVLVSALTVSCVADPAASGVDPAVFHPANPPLPNSLPAETVGHFESLRSEGIGYVEAGDLLAARDRFQSGVELSKSPGAESFQIRFLINVANTDLALHQYESAMRGYLEARRAAEAAGERTLAAVAAANIGWLYSASGSFEDAAEVLRNAMAILPGKDRSRFLGNMLHQKMIVEIRLGRWDRAWEAAARALDLAGETADLSLQADILDAAGYELLRAGRWRHAEPLLIEAFRLRRIHSLPLPGLTYRNLGILHREKGDLRSAERFLNTALEADSRTPDALPRWTIHYYRATVLEAAGRFREAIEELNRAIELIRRLRIELLPSDSIRMRAGVPLRTVYESYLNCAARMYDNTRDSYWIRRSFEVSQQSRAAALVETLREGDATRRKLGPEFWQTLRRLIAAERGDLLAGAPSSALGALSRRRIEALRHRLTELEIRAGLGGVSDPVPPPVSTSELQRRLSDSEALLAFALTERSSYLWALTREGLEFETLPPASVLRRKASGFRTVLEQDGPAAARAGRELHNLLFDGLSREVQSKRHWILAPDGALLDLPFAALVSGGADGEPRYLVEDHSLRVAPGAGLLLLPAGSEAGDGLVVVGDPVYNRADPRWEPPLNGDETSEIMPVSSLMTAGPRAGFEMARLAGSAREVEVSVQQWRSAGGWAVGLTGRRARGEDLMRALESRPAVVHFATHVLPGPGQPGSGYIALSLDADGAPELLGTSAIASFPVDPELVLMSGCSSAQGRILPGEGLLGLTRAWLRAGARHVVATRWPVPDDQGEMLRAFYRELLPRGERGFREAPHEALRTAQMHLIRGGGWRSAPRYWAAYSLISAE